MLTPQEVASRAFPKAVMGGYNMASVDEFLDELSDDYSALYKENAVLKSKLKVLVEKVEDYRATEDSMRATLLTAQKMADSIVKEAEQKRDGMLAEARAQAQSQMGELDRQRRESEARLAQGKQELADFIATARSDTDAIGFQRGARCCMSVLHYTDGDLAGKDYTLFPEPLEEDSEALSELLRQYYVNRNLWPRTILLPFEVEDGEEIASWLGELSGHRVALEVPRRGDRAAFVEKAQLNAREEILRATTQAERHAKALEWLQKAMGLPVPPVRIEAYDISNTGDSDIVAAMTVHVEGKPR